MRWVMEYDLLGELANGLQQTQGTANGEGEDNSGPDPTVSVEVC